MADLDYGTVKRIDPASGRPYVEVKGRTGAHVHGPCPVVVAFGTSVTPTTATVVGEHGSHTHDLGAVLVEGARVLVGYVGDAREAVVVGLLR